MKLEIEEELYEKLKNKIKGAGFTVESYIIHILEEVVSEEKEKTNEDFTTEDEEKVKERLRALGYMD